MISLFLAVLVVSSIFSGSGLMATRSKVHSFLQVIAEIVALTRILCDFVLL